MDRVLPSEGRGCWFDPSRAHQASLLNHGFCSASLPAASLQFSVFFVVILPRPPSFCYFGHWVTSASRCNPSVRAGSSLRRDFISYTFATLQPAISSNACLSTKAIRFGPSTAWSQRSQCPLHGDPRDSIQRTRFCSTQPCLKLAGISVLSSRFDTATPRIQFPQNSVPGIALERFPSTSCRRADAICPRALTGAASWRWAWGLHG